MPTLFDDVRARYDSAMQNASGLDTAINGQIQAFGQQMDQRKPQGTIGDRITQVLAKRAPGLQDVTGAAVDAYVGGKSFGETLNAARAARLKEQATLADIMLGKQNAITQAKRASLEEARMYWQQMESMAQQGQRDHELIVDALKTVAADDPETIIKLVQAVNSNPDDPGYSVSPQTALSDVVRIAGLENIRLAKPKEVDPWKNYKVVGGTLYEMGPDGKPRAAIEVAQSEAPEMPYSGTSMDAQNMNILLRGDPSSPEYQAAYNSMAEPRVTLNPTTGEQVIIRKDMSAFRSPTSRPTSGATAGVDISTVRPGKMSFEEAQRISGLQGALDEISTAEGLLFKGDKFDKEVALAARDFSIGGVGVSGIPGTEGRTARQAMKRAIEVILRTRTGAAAPETEVQSYLDQFFPSPADNAQQARKKLDAAKKFLDETRQLFFAGRGGTPPETTTSTRYIITPEGNIVPKE